MLRRLNKCCSMSSRILAGIGVCGAASALRAEIVLPAFKIETEIFYVQVGMVVSDGIAPVADRYILAAPNVFWATSAIPDPLGGPAFPPGFAEMTFTGAAVSARGFSTHISMPHPSDAPMGDTFAYTLATPLPAFPPGWGAVEDRRRGVRSHPAGHRDVYQAVVGALVGTVPGPSVLPRVVLITGSVGVHPTIGTGLAPIATGGVCTPPSGIPNAQTGDFPAAQVQMAVERDTGRFVLVMVVAGLQSPGQVSAIALQDGPFGPPMIELLPLCLVSMQNPRAPVFYVENGVLPQHVLPQLESGAAYLRVQIPASLHPDGRILGQMTIPPCGAGGAGPDCLGLTGDMNCDGLVSISDIGGFVLALTDPQQYHQHFPGCDINHADINGDGLISVGDIGGMVALLTG